MFGATMSLHPKVKSPSKTCRSVATRGQLNGLRCRLQQQGSPSPMESPQQGHLQASGPGLQDGNTAFAALQMCQEKCALVLLSMDLYPCSPQQQTSELHPCAGPVGAWQFLPEPSSGVVLWHSVPRDSVQPKPGCQPAAVLGSAANIEAFVAAALPAAAAVSARDVLEPRGPPLSSRASAWWTASRHAHVWAAPSCLRYDISAAAARCMQHSHGNSCDTPSIARS